MAQYTLNLSDSNKEALEQILSAAGGEAMTQAQILVEEWKRKNGLSGSVILGPNGEVYTSDTPADVAKREAEALAVLESQEAEATRIRNLVIIVIAILAVVGVGSYFINKK